MNRRNRLRNKFHHLYRKILIKLLKPLVYRGFLFIYSILIEVRTLPYGQYNQNKKLWVIQLI